MKRVSFFGSFLLTLPSSDVTTSYKEEDDEEQDERDEVGWSGVLCRSPEVGLSDVGTPY